MSLGGRIFGKAGYATFVAEFRVTEVSDAGEDRSVFSG